MNKVILMGRLVKEPEIRYTQGAEPMAVARYTLAINRRFKRQGEPEADFIGCVAFGKAGEFAEKYFRKGQMVSVIGRIQVRSWDDANGIKRWSTDVIIEEQYFAESKSSYESRNEYSTQNSMPSYQQPMTPQNNNMPSNDGFYTIDESLEDDDLPF